MESPSLNRSRNWRSVGALRSCKSDRSSSPPARRDSQTRRSDGIFVAPFEIGEIGPDLFRHACIMGLEGLVSKHAQRAYSVGRCNHWLKSKNPNHPAYRRVQDQF